MLIGRVYILVTFICLSIRWKLNREDNFGESLKGNIICFNQSNHNLSMPRALGLSIIASVTTLPDLVSGYICLARKCRMSTMTMMSDSDDDEHPEYFGMR